MESQFWKEYTNVFTKYVPSNNSAENREGRSSVVTELDNAEFLKLTRFFPCLRAFSAFNTHHKSVGENLTTAFFLRALTSPSEDQSGKSEMLAYCVIWQ